MRETYESLKAQIRELERTGKVQATLTREERIDWAYGNTKIENDEITWEMAAAAVDRKSTSVG